MRRVLLLLPLLIGCGGGADCDEFAVTVDGEEARGCGSARLAIAINDHGIFGGIFSPVPGELPAFDVRFAGSELPTTLEVREQRPNNELQLTPPWTSAIAQWGVGSDFMRSRSGTATLAVGGGRATLRMSGIAARRDGSERPFVLEYEGPVELMCGACLTEDCGRRDPDARACDKWERVIAE